MSDVAGFFDCPVPSCNGAQLQRIDFPEGAIRPHGIAAVHPDAFVVQSLEVFEDEVCQAFQSQRGLLRCPPKTVVEHLATLEKVGLVQAVALLRTLNARL